MSNGLLKHDLQCYEETSVDIEDLLHNTYNLIRLSRPLVGILHTLDALRRWEPWWLCLLLLCVGNFICLFFGDYLIVFVISAVLLLAGLGYIDKRTNILVKVIPPCHSDSEPHRLGFDENLVNFDQDRCLVQSELVEEFRLLLCLQNEVTDYLTKLIVSLISITRWQDSQKSLIFYSFLFAVPVLLHTTPFHYIMALVINTALLHYPVYQYFVVLKGMHGSTAPVPVFLDAQLSSDESDQEAIPDLSHALFNMNVTCDETKMADSDNQEEDEKSDASTSDEVGVVEIKVGASNTSLSSANYSDTTSLGKKRQGVVGKILKTVKNQASSGSCEGCKVNFTTILKRRRLCSHCGNHFCSRCCSYKVTRSMFGATAPAAQTETVSVCFYCFTYLNKIVKPNGEPRPVESTSTAIPKDKTLN